MTREELIKSWVDYRGEANVTTDQLQAIKWAWETLRGKNSQMPCRCRAKQVKDGKWIVGWFVMHHIAKTDRHDNLEGYEEVPMLFNDAPGVRDKGTYWHAIDPSTLEVIKEQLSLFEEL